MGGTAPAGWTATDFDDRAWTAGAAGQFAPSGSIAPGGLVTPIDVPVGGRLLVRQRFEITEPARVRVLELRVGYADAFIAWVNGTEVARRGLPAAAADSARPDRSHGPEIERVYVPASPGLLRLAGNLLAVEIRSVPTLIPGAQRPAGSVAVAAASGIRIVRGPYLVAPGDGAVSVAWETDLAAQGEVEWEIDPDDGGRPSVVRSAVRGLRHVVRLARLRPDRAFHYQVRAEAAAGPGAVPDLASAGPFRFHTAPRSGGPLRFVVYGDMRAPGHAAHRQVVEGIVREAPDLVVNTGDLVDRGSEESDWQRYFEITAPLGLSTAIVPALGNHDAARSGEGTRKTWGLFGMTPNGGSEPGYTSFDLAGVHFVILDSNRYRDAAQKDWLRSDLMAARRKGARAILAFCHEGLWAHGLHGGRSDAAKEYGPILAEGGVDLLASGHDHLYERGQVDGLPYVVSGGGGAPLYNPSCRPEGPGAALFFADVPGPLKPCPRSVAVMAKAYHYIVIDVFRDSVRLCPRLPDGTPLEACSAIKLRRRR